MDEWEKAWLACAIDSEGFITFNHYKSMPRDPARPYIGVCNTNYAFTARCTELMKSLGAVSVYSIKQKRRTNELPVFNVRAQNHSTVQAVLKEILPYLIIKRERAETVLAFIALRNSKKKGASYTLDEFLLIGKVKQLNQRHPNPAGKTEYIRGSYEGLKV